MSTKVGNPTSFDPADYGRVLSAGGCMIMGLNTVPKYQEGADVSKAIRENLEKTLLCGGFNLASAKATACIATASSKIFDEVPGLMNALENGFDTLANITGKAIGFRGMYQVEKDKLVVYTLIAGLGKPAKRLDELMKFKQLNKETHKLY